MFLRPRLDVHTLAFDLCLMVEEQLAWRHDMAGPALRVSSRLTRNQLARMCEVDDPRARLVAYEKARDGCLRAAASVEGLRVRRLLSERERDRAMDLCERLMDKILDLACPLERGA